MNQTKQIELAQGSLRLHAEHVARLMDVASRAHHSGRDASHAEEKLAMFETLMWKQHRRWRSLRASG